MISRRRLRRMLRRVLHTGDSPGRTAAAYSLGVFLGMSPFLGLHTLLALALAFLLRLNRLAVLLGSFILNPWTFLPIYAAGTSLGLLLTGQGLAEFPSLDFTGVDALAPADLIAWFRRLGPYLVPFVLGNLVLAAFGGVLAYPVSYYLVVRLRAARAARRKRREAARRDRRISQPPAAPITNRTVSSDAPRHD